MNAEEAVEFRYQLGLIGLPKIRRRRAVISAMDKMFGDGWDDEDVRQVIGTSDSAWARAQSWYREAKGLNSWEPLGTGVVPKDEREIRTWAPRRRAEESEVEKAMQRQRGWSQVRQRDERRRAAEMGTSGSRVWGQDVGVPLADAFYSVWQEKQRELRDKSRRQAGE